MNLRKFISGVSAFAIAASAFAGLAVTANAETQNLVSENFETADSNGFTNLRRGSSTIVDGTEINTTKVAKFTTNSNAGNSSDAVPGGFTSYRTVDSAISSASFDFNLAGKYMAINLVNSNDFSLTAVNNGNWASMNKTGVFWSFGTTRQNFTGTKTGADWIGINGEMKKEKSQNSASYADYPASEFDINTWYHAVVSFDYTNKTTSYSIYAYRADGDYSSAMPLDSSDSKGFWDTNLTSYANTVAFVCGSGSQTAYIDNLVINTDTDMIPKYDYTIKAKTSDNTPIITIAASTQAAGDLQYNGIPEVVTDGTYYYRLDDEAVTNHSKTFTVTSGTNDFAVTYTLDLSIVSFMEAENLGNTTSSDLATASAGKKAYIAGGKTPSIATLPAGEYEMETSIIDRPDRGVILRDENTNNAQSELCGIKTANVTTASFNIPAETNVLVSGYSSTNTTGDKFAINQSATFDYIIIRRTGDYTGSAKTSPAAVLVANSAEGSANKGAVYKATVSGDESYTYSYLAAAVVPVNKDKSNGGHSLQSQILKQTITGAGSVSVAIAVNGLSADEIESVSVTLK